MKHASTNGSAPQADPFDALGAEAKAAVTESGNALRRIQEQYREAYAAELSNWQRLRDELDALEGSTEAGDPRLPSFRERVDLAGGQVARHRAELGRLEVAVRNLESTWLFLGRDDSSLVSDPSHPASAAALQMRIIEAQESERARLAQEVHDGPAQSLTNAIFQVEYIERVLDEDGGQLARTELRYLRELLRRELGDIRSFISWLRPPLLDELGLDGALRETGEHASVLAGIPIRIDLRGNSGGLGETQRTVALRVAQEALQNVRKHAAASSASLVTRLDDGAWVLEVSDDGRGFDTGTVAARGRRNFGVQFMRERADLIGARFDLRSLPGGGTVVRLFIPVGEEENA